MEVSSSSNTTQGGQQKSNKKQNAIRKNNNEKKKTSKPRGSSRSKKTENSITSYPAYWTLNDCLTRYNTKDPNIIRGNLRVLPQKDAMGFCTCDRGSQKLDVVLEGPLERNRALDGDTVFVELLDDNEEEGDRSVHQEKELESMEVDDDDDDGDDEEEEEEENESLWQDSPMQMNLWAPVVPIQRKHAISTSTSLNQQKMTQRKGRVVYVVPPKTVSSEINPTKQIKASCRKIVGILKRLQSGTTLLTCSNKSLPQFRLSNGDAKKFKNAPDDAIFQAKYTYGSWKENFHWPPCSDVVQFGLSCNIEDETAALLIENQVDHGDFPAHVLEECQNVVRSGEYSNGAASGWRPTPEMYMGRRDYRKRRIFTIDPTTAKDLDDALHIEDLGNGQVEVGVHIADVSFFVESGARLDDEAKRRCTTVYLVDRTVPMLPRPLCEIACSLNENVERLAFSCVWKMNRDGSIVKGQKVWYGRSVIKVSTACLHIILSYFRNFGPTLFLSSCSLALDWIILQLKTLSRIR